MFPYWLLFSVFAFGALQRQNDDQLRRQLTPLLALAVLITMLMVGLRFQVGGDWYNYQLIYSRIGLMNLGQALTTGLADPGYSLLNWISYHVGADIWLVNILCGAIFIWGVLRLALQEPNPWLFFVVAVPYLIIVVGMGYTRQAVAVGLLIAALASFREARLGRAILWIILAAAFHKSAVVLLPLVGLAVAKNRFATNVLIAVIGAFLYYLLVAGHIDVLTESYLEEQLESEGAVIRVFMNVIPAAVFLAFRRRFGFSGAERKLWTYLALAAFATAVGLVVLPSSTVIDRLGLYIIPLQLIVLARIPTAFGHQNNPSTLMLLGVVAYSAVVQFVWLNYATHAQEWIPYRMYISGSDSRVV